MSDMNQDNIPYTPESVYGSNLDIADCINKTCPWSGKPVQADSLTVFDGNFVGFCNPGCRDQFESAVRHFEEAKASQGAR